MFIFVAPDILFIDWKLFPAQEPQQHTLICLSNHKVVLEHVLLQHVCQIRHIEVPHDIHLMDWIQGYIQGQVDALAPVSGVLSWISKTTPHAHMTHWLITNQLCYQHTKQVHIKRAPTVKLSVPKMPLPARESIDAYISEEDNEV